MEQGYVYCLRFRSSNFYVGSSINPAKRLIGHRTSCLSKNPNNKFMARCWKKFGEPELYILAKVPEHLLLEEEQKFIDLVFGKQGCVNLNPYANKPPGWEKGRKHSAKSIEKMRKPRTEETKAKMRKPKSAETRAKMSASLRVRVVPQEQRVRGGKSVSITFAKPEIKLKMITTQPSRKIVIATNENETIEFHSVREAGRVVSGNKTSIVRAIKNKSVYRNYTWTYK